MQSDEIELSTCSLEESQQLQTAGLALLPFLYHVVFDLLRQFANHIIYTPHPLLSLLLFLNDAVLQGIGLLPYLLMQYL